MPFAWNSENERTILLVALSQGGVQPGAALWNAMIEALGGGVTDRAVRYKVVCISLRSLFESAGVLSHIHFTFASDDIANCHSGFFFFEFLSYRALHSSAGLASSRFRVGLLIPNCLDWNLVGRPALFQTDERKLPKHKPELPICSWLTLNLTLIKPSANPFSHHETVRDSTN